MSRALIFSDSKVVNLISTRFIPCAVRTGWYLAPEEKDFLKQIKHPGGTFRMYACTAGGKGLPLRAAKSKLDQFEAVLSSFQPESNLRITDLSETSRKLVTEPPPGTEVVYVVWNVLDGMDLLSLDKHPVYGKLQREAGFDRLWIRKDEAVSLAKGEFPESLKKRMFTKVNQVFFVPKPQQLDVTLNDGRLSGRVLAKEKSSDDGYQLDLLGFVESKRGKLSRFDMVAKGTWQSDRVSAYASNLAWAAKKHRPVTIAVSFTLADPGEALAKTPPHAVYVPEAMNGYLNP
jgi:hypothetical protein